MMEACPFAWTFCVLFMLVSTFAMLEFFIAVMVGAMQPEAS